MTSLSPPPFAQPASFVHLTPLNTEARRAFNDVALLAASHVESASTSTTQGRNIRHPAKFMVIEPWGAPSPLLKPHREQSQSKSPPSFSNTGDVERDISSELNTSFGSSPLPALEEFQYQGFYDLSFQKILDIPRIGWVAGIGRWNPDGRTFTDTGVVDLMLAPSDGKKLYNVRGKHATLYFNESGSLCIRSPLEAPSFLGTEDFSGSRVVISKSQIVLFGNLT
jgi:hypothetical protein